MNEEFLTVYKVLGIEWAEFDEPAISAPDMVRKFRSNPELLERQRSFWEHILTTINRKTAEDLVRVLFNATCYVSNLIGGPLPVLLPRNKALLLARTNANLQGSAMTIARSIRSLVCEQSVQFQAPREEQLLARIEETVGRAAFQAVPANGRYLSTAQIAAQLSLAPKTVRRLCNQGQIIAKKLAGGEWRTTQADLDRSPYLQKRGKGRAPLE